MKDPRAPFCSFCGRSHLEAIKVVVGPVMVAICDTCVDDCADIITDRQRPREMLWGDIGIHPTQALGWFR